MELGLIAIGAALAIGLAALATGLAQAKIGSAAAGAIAEKPELTGRAIQRLGIVVQPVRAAPAAGGQTGGREVIPYSAVVYDTDGSTWTYANTAVRTFVRQPITIAAIQGNLAVLSGGPPVGTEVVTVGAAELLGTEYDISGEE